MKNNLVELEIGLSLKQIRDMSKKNWTKLVNQKCSELAFKTLIYKKLKLKKGKEIIYSELKIRKYLNPESYLNLEEMKQVMRTRLEVELIPGCLHFKFNLSKKCRFGCDMDENILHTITCKNDKIDIKSMSVKDLIVIYEDKIVKKHKVKILELKNIIFTRKNMLQSAALDQGIK